jgi:hypothetical protein
MCGRLNNSPRYYASECFSELGVKGSHLEYMCSCGYVWAGPLYNQVTDGQRDLKYGEVRSAFHRMFDLWCGTFDFSDPTTVEQLWNTFRRTLREERDAGIGTYVEDKEEEKKEEKKEKD